MPGWKTTAMKQSQDEESFLSKNKIEDNLKNLRERLRPEDSLLDVGCFLGHLYQELGHKNYTGVDIYPEHIASAQRLNPGVKFIASDLHDLEGKWDVVWCC